MLLSPSGINLVALSLKKMVAFTQRFLMPSLVDISPLLFENMMCLKTPMYVHHFVIISPCKSLQRLEFSLSMNAYTNWHLSWNGLNCSGKEVYFFSNLHLHLQNCVVSRYQRPFLSSMQSCISFILAYISANHKGVTTLVQIRTYLRLG